MVRHPSDDPRTRNGSLPGRRDIVVTLVRASAISGSLLAAYFLLPLDMVAEAPPVLVLVAGGVALGFVGAAQLRAVVRSGRPVLRGVEALAVAVPSLVLLFSAVYVVLSRQDVSSFSEPLTRVGALYFAATTFSTTGFGDIVARSDLARMVVSAQMLVDLVVLGLGIKVVVGAVQFGLQRSKQTPDPD